ncbi:MAG: hypothetical protein OSB65_15145 [Roseibacillus sp.]|nr:hypothetical protein [Roseibacillus sp.]
MGGADTGYLLPTVEFGSDFHFFALAALVPSLREGDTEADEVPRGGGSPDDALPESGDGRGVLAERTARSGGRIDQPVLGGCSMVL